MENKSSSTKSAPSPEERRFWIAEAAYYRAEKRGFLGGDCIEDWLSAEMEIDQTIASARSKPARRKTLVTSTPDSTESTKPKRARKNTKM